MDNTKVKKKVVLSYLIYDQFDEHEVECARKGAVLNIAIYDALNSIRNRLKYCCDETTESEIKFLEQLRAELSHVYIEE